MNRLVDYKYLPAINYALELLPSGIYEYVKHVHFLTGTNPTFAGLHNYITTEDGRSYKNTSHCVHPFHQKNLPRDLRHPTIVLTEIEEPPIVIHELGHVLHGTINFNYSPMPISEYAETNRFEAFAEAFSAFVLPNYSPIHIGEEAEWLFSYLANSR